MLRSLGVFLALLLAAAAIGIGAYTYEHWTLAAGQEQAIRESADEIFRSPSSFVAGNPNGDVSVVDFFDYNCPDCRTGEPSIAKLLANDPKIRLVLKELPVLSEDSDAVARLALAANKQGKYLELHDALFRERGHMNLTRALDVAKALGLDPDKLKQDSNDPEILRTITANKRLAHRLGIKGVPVYLVGDQVVPDDPDDLYRELKQRVADIRQNGCHAKC